MTSQNGGLYISAYIASRLNLQPDENTNSAAASICRIHTHTVTTLTEGNHRRQQKIKITLHVKTTQCHTAICMAISTTYTLHTMLPRYSAAWIKLYSCYCLLAGVSVLYTSHKAGAELLPDSMMPTNIFSYPAPHG